MAGTALEFVEFDPFAGPQIEAAVPSTEPQREIWTACRLGEEASLAFNESWSLRLIGPLDRCALEGSLRDAVLRHEALRMTFSADGLTLLVSPDVPEELQFRDFSRCAPEARAAALAELIDLEVRKPFDLERGPLYRCQLVCLAPQEHALVFTAHHLVCDGWSTGVLVQDWGVLYSARVRGEGAELSEPQRFSDYARAEAASVGTAEQREAEAYWLGLYAQELPVLDLPFDRPRPALKSFPSRRLDHVLDGELVSRLKKTAAKSGASFFAALLGGFSALLHRLSGQQDFAIGIAAAAQAAGDYDRLVGHCVNTLPIRAGVAAQLPAEALMRMVGSQVLDAFEHQSLTLGALLKQLALPRDPSRLPLVSILFNLDVSLGRVSFQDLEATFEVAPRAYENFDLFVSAVDTGSSVVLQCQYNTDLLDASTLKSWLEGYGRLLAGIAAEPACAVGRLPLLGEGEREAYATWNATQAEYPRERTIAALFSEQARRTPERVALDFEGTSLSYGELECRSNRLARRLRALGVRRDVLVGLCVERSPDMVVGLLGILKAGGAYVPLDPNYPPERLAFMVEDSGMRLLVAQQATRTLVPTAPVVVCLDDDAATIAAESAAPLPADDDAAIPDSLAYVIYTSGSTGKPKGVLVPHRALVNFVWSIQREPGVADDDVLVAVTTLSFDIAGLELHVPLSVGARVVLASREVASDGALLRELVERTRATLLQATPATWRLLLAAGWQPPRTFKALAGGEALPRDLVELLLEHLDVVWNMYGPTETTIWSTCAPLRRPLDRIVIGRPMANTQVYVLDALGQQVPPLVGGELHIGGDGVTLGYLNRPELTAERFVPDPFRGEGRLYRTGDVARWLADGSLECLGRNDGQVKVRGFRIELGEIEAALARHDGIGQAVVAAREFRPGDVRLVAYLKPTAATVPDEDELRSLLRRSLPEYMVPQHFVSLATFPLTPSGKIDRKALPLPQQGEGQRQSYEGPRSGAEQYLAGVWQDVLQVARVSIHDDFFALGGHSLLAAQILARVRRERSVALPFRAFFEAPTVARFAALLESAGEAVGIQVPRRAGADRAPLTLTQQRLLMLEEADPRQQLAHRLGSAFRLLGALDVAALERAVNEIRRRQDALRSVVVWEVAAPVQLVRPYEPVPLPTADWTGLAAEERERRLLPFLLDEARQPLDLATGPLFRAQLLELAENEHVLFFRTHSVIWDGWSFDVFRAELAALYEAYAAARPSPLPELTVSFGDYAAWHDDWLKGPELRKQAEFWSNRLAEPWPALELPADHTGGDGGDAETIRLRLSREEAEGITALAQQCAATPFMVVLAAFDVQLHRYTGQRRVQIGSPVRARSLPELEGLIGVFVNSVVLRAEVDPDESFVGLLRKVRSDTADAFSHQDLPFEMLGRNAPVLRVFFSLQDVRGRSRRLGDIQLEQIGGVSPGGAADLSVWFLDEGDSGMFVALNYRKDLFERSTMETFLSQYRTLLASIVADPRQSVARLEMQSPAERAPIVSSPVPEPMALDTLLSRLGQHATATPDVLAYDSDADSLTWAQLDAAVSRLEAQLREGGCSAASTVAVLGGSTATRLCGVLACLRLGAVCVPLDPDDPPSRQLRVLAATQASALLTDGTLESDSALPVIPLELVAGPAVTRTPGSSSSVPPESPALLLPAAVGGGRLAAVAISRGALAATVATSVELTQPARVSGVLLAALAPGQWIPGALLALAHGCPIVGVEDDIASDGHALGRVLDASGASILVAPPATWTELACAGWSRRIELGICAGGPLPRESAQAVAEQCRAVVAVQDSPEAGLWSFAYVADPQPTATVAVRPLGGARLDVFDDQGRAAPTGVLGELWVAGPQLASGYRCASAVASDRFVKLVAAGETWCRTGVRARALARGGIRTYGRLDGQLEVGAVRVDPEEICAALRLHEGVRDAAVVVVGSGPLGAKLVAGFVPDPRHAAMPGQLRKHLVSLLPPSLIPSTLVELQASPNGLVDRSALTRLVERGLAPLQARHEPRTEAERLVASVWSRLLGVESVGVHDNFFDLGGHSLLAVAAARQIQAAGGGRVGLRQLAFATLEQIAASLATA